MFGEITEETILKYDQQVPRYTSYPTAVQFTPDVNYKTYKTWLQNLPEKESLSLYIHIPFCQEMCWYCGCFTKVTKRYAPVEDYVKSLIEEIRLVARILSKKHQVSHIHFGGGSPTILLPSNFENLVQVLNQEFEIIPNAEIAIEVDPRNVDEGKIISYAKCGVNRVSIGVQDFNDEVQAAINRRQSFELVENVVAQFRKHGISAINFDLVYGLPKQSLEGLENNINAIAKLKPQRIALFSYAHVPWMKKHMRLINESDLPSGLEKIRMYKTAAQKLENIGYFPIGLDHFVKKNDSMFDAFCSEKLKRNFQGYSSDKGENIIGFGASSISYLNKFGYVQNVTDFVEYKKVISASELPVAKGVELSKEDKMRKKIIDEIMCYLEVDLKKIYQAENLNENYFAKELNNLEELKKDGLLKIKNNVIKINLSAPQASRLVASFFDKYFQPVLNRHSKMA